VWEATLASWCTGKQTSRLISNGEWLIGHPNVARPCLKGFKVQAETIYFCKSRGG